MLQNQEHVKDLILFEFTGHIKEHQQAYLNFLLEEYPRVALLRKQILEKFCNPGLQTALKELEDFGVTFLRLVVKMNKRRYVNRRWRLRRTGGKLKKIFFKNKL